MPYEEYIVINGGEFCGVCGRTRDELPDPSRRLDRDHEHKADGLPRGLLCRECNRKLKAWITLEWARRVVAYLERAEEGRDDGA